MAKLYTHDWDNGTATTIEPNDVTGQVTIEDRSPRLANGVQTKSYSVIEALELADEHMRFAIKLRAAARRAQ